MTKEEFLKSFVALLGGFMKSSIYEKLKISSKGELALLSYLSKYHSVTPGELIDILHVGSGRVANALSNLERKQYIERKKDENDKRKTIVTITEKGSSIIKEKKREFRERAYIIYDILGSEDVESLLRIMKKFESARESKEYV